MQKELSIKEIGQTIITDLFSLRFHFIFHSFFNDDFYLKRGFKKAKMSISFFKMTDTQKLSSKVSGDERRISLKELIKKCLGISAKKEFKSLREKENFHNGWGNRPLTKERISYIVDDVIYLAEIVRILNNKQDKNELKKEENCINDLEKRFNNLFK